MSWNGENDVDVNYTVAEEMYENAINSNFTQEFTAPDEINFRVK